MSHEILKAKNEISMVLRGRKSIAPIFFPFLTVGCGQPSVYGKEMLSIISKGRKWEGNNVDFPFGREKGGKLTFSFPFFPGKGNPADPC